MTQPDRIDEPIPNRTDQPQVTHAMEDYLKAVYRLRDVVEPGGQVTTQRLADELGVTGPSVTNMVKRLHELRLLRHTRYHGVELTPAGEKIALEVLRHHRLLELYLAETLGYAWDEVHAEAERLEHHVSDELEARMDSVLGHPTRDPHGDPIPSREGQIDTISAISLVDLGAGEPATVSRVSDRDPEQLRYLGGLGLYPGANIVVAERLPFDGPLRIQVAGAEHIIGRSLAGAVQVVPHPPS
ncbi:MAG: DtxR family transcriptional regulator, Mn-dependent transcriptional regulator [Thermomicrobiales bacterium]|nr:DtxR family transcriptional regulator, Mn-dependent transcriptional regulator [Thermomicrobiales bacterium]MEA2524213.1 DtxR family transcriptional regulator, Mn-dependent transcriptional regulator [Thermomicrobiales bacterium]MEA2528412.1 DtxR family transcriptional regulator, Mn-dependent transcriptional regulator [Thermomicrobiales bacterium]MEA2584958.1 DtxR family transcriptional regulator, Mn-dependent transcriptional regulator [Thermomicrobiales bacterium]MEA2598549.1 DtxR family tran